MSVAKTIIEFLIFTVILKAIVAHWLAQKIIEWVNKANVRNLAIWQHWIGQAKGQGHIGEVLSCNDGNCATF